uniref:Uncharacterized protein n=1 Tax=Megaselia scalaris TaxID=36166 RepID=T1GZJ2_MEGSC
MVVSRVYIQRNTRVNKEVYQAKGGKAPNFELNRVNLHQSMGKTKKTEGIKNRKNLRPIHMRA